MGYPMRIKIGYPGKKGKGKNGKINSYIVFIPFLDLPKIEKMKTVRMTVKCRNQDRTEQDLSLPF